MLLTTYQNYLRKYLCCIYLDRRVVLREGRPCWRLLRGGEALGIAYEGVSEEIPRGGTVLVVD